MEVDEDADEDQNSISFPATSYNMDPRLRKWLSVLLEPSHLQLIARSMPVVQHTTDPAHMAHAQRVSSFLLSVMTSWSAKKTVS